MTDETRLALLHFKAHTHLNSILIFHFQQFKPFTYFQPNVLKVQIPTAADVWDGDEMNSESQPTDTIASFFGTKNDHLQLARVSSLIAWDFCLGMVVSSYLVSPPDEERVQLWHRLKPFLFPHVKIAPEKS